MVDIGPKMAFILKAYQMTADEVHAESERDLQLFCAGGISQREQRDRNNARNLARDIRARDDAPGPPWPHPWRNKNAVKQAAWFAKIQKAHKRNLPG